MKFWCQLHSGRNYKELSSLALILLAICPTSVLYERHLSIMNYIRDEYRSLLMHENLNACMAIAMTQHSVDTLPFLEL